MDQIVLTTDDVTVRQSDLDSCECWLTDIILSFAYSELERSLHAPTKAQVGLVQASTVFMGNVLEGADLATIVANLKLSTKAFVFLPINNNADPDRARGGSHWSLLVYSRTANEFWYFDSCNNMNQSAAMHVARSFANALHVDLTSPPSESVHQLNSSLTVRRTQGSFANHHLNNRTETTAAFMSSASQWHWLLR
jgi:hypothetical protein